MSVIIRRPASKTYEFKPSLSERTQTRPPPAVPQSMSCLSTSHAARLAVPDSGANSETTPTALHHNTTYRMTCGSLGE